MDAKASDRNCNLAIRNLSRCSSVAVRCLKGRTSFLGSGERISQLIAKQAVPLSGGSFSIALDALVPAEIQVRSLPSEAEQLAPQLRGFDYVIVEEQIALVDQRTRKVEIVFPRWGSSN